MDAFALRQRILQDYSDYVHSFLKIRDPKVREYVIERLAEGVLWPEPLLQLNPSYEVAGTVGDLVNEGVLHPLCAQVFVDRNGSPFRLYRHQEEAIRIAARREPYVLTSGTGSGKSLAYFIPIVDHVLKHNPGRHSVRAIIVYPMNALVNSQLESIDRLASNTPNFPVRFARYTGQEDDKQRQQLIDDPPHVLMTNYVMLELMLTRTRERVFTDRATGALQFLVMDELHSYGGRQGADVSMLIRRLRERCGNPNLLCIGTSATMAAGGSRQDQREAVARVASTIFGVPVRPTNVVDETLRRVTVPSPRRPPSPDLSEEGGGLSRLSALSQIMGRGAGGEGFSYDDIIHHPLAAWIEETFGIQEIEGHLCRRSPITLKAGAERLSAETGTDVETCRAALEAMFRLGSRIPDPDGNPAFAFKLHQFISQGDSVYATLDAPSQRHLTMQGQTYAPGEGVDRPLFPLVFCRECGQEYLQVRLLDREGRVVSTLAELDEEEDETENEGYLLVEDPDNPVWSLEREQDLPDNWFHTTLQGRTPRKEFDRFIPRSILVRPDGSFCPLSQSIGRGAGGEGSLAWFIAKPFLTCLNCGVVYTRRDRSEFKKLARLSSEGRSTATTLVGLSTVAGLKEQGDMAPSAQKLLSFTDNRQDASLQAGHFNDFVQVALLRSAIYRALPEDGSPLDHANIAQEVVRALNLPEHVYARAQSAGDSAPPVYGGQRSRMALQKLIEYRIYEDLRRGWRVVQPNLEQCGLLHIKYKNLQEVCATSEVWRGHPLLASASPETRYRVARAFLDHLRRELAIDAAPLTEEYQERMIREVNEALNDNWALGLNPALRLGCWFVPGEGPRQREDSSLSERSALGRYLRSSGTWPGLRQNLSVEEYDKLLSAWVEVLKREDYLIVRESDGAVRLRAGALLWERGDGTPVEPDPIRSRRMRPAENGDQVAGTEREANLFFTRFYTQVAAELGGMSGEAHTGQISKVEREKREGLFREGKLALLFCSPTMELGIDIADLNSVHLRNVPPSPANYVQRSGRAGRSGQPALVTTYCAVGSGHDQYFFKRPVDMVSGAVTPPRLDLTNEDLVKAHVHAIWLAKTGLDLKRSVMETLDTGQPGYPLRENPAHQIVLSNERLQECLQECQRVLVASAADMEQTTWYSEDWLWRILKDSPNAFDRAFDRWRELYDAADRQLKEARRVIDSSYQQHISREERQAAERQEREARRQKDILCNKVEDTGDTDFNPYRYLASEGFLPGYNFPRLPIRAYIPAAGQDGEFISRARFLALSEFGPGNIIYHEGRKYRVTRSQLPGGDVQQRMVRAKICLVCGAFHEGESARVDVCEYCGTRLNADTSDYTEKLFEMTDVITRRTERITCDEEERRREGYEITSAFRFAHDEHGLRQVKAQAHDAEGHPLFTLTLGPAATLWRVNHGWRRSQDKGFTLNQATGEWVGRPGDDDAQSEVVTSSASSQCLTGVRLMVRDTRNILLLHPFASPLSQNTERGAGSEGLSFDAATLASLQSALERGMELVFQIDTDELAAERLGKDDRRGILFWEAAEGGLGILGRLVEEPATLANVAKAALEICHFGPEGQDLRPPDELDGCVRSCYDCLLSYSNQRDHSRLNRHLIRDILLALASGRVQRETQGRPYDEQYQWLWERTDPASELERKFLRHLYETGRKLPDYAQTKLQDVFVQPDFYYKQGVCIFCDGSVHDVREVSRRDRETRQELADRGYRVVTIRYDRDLEEQLGEYPDVFGEARQ